MLETDLQFVSAKVWFKRWTRQWPLGGFVPLGKRLCNTTEEPCKKPFGILIWMRSMCLNMKFTPNLSWMETMSIPKNSEIVRRFTGLVYCLIYLGPRRAGCACQGCSEIEWPHSQAQTASSRMSLQPRKNRLISSGSMRLASDIKLIITDTTLDLSQKAKQGMLLKS